MDTLACTGCRRSFPYEQFYVNPKTGKRRALCRACHTDEVAKHKNIDAIRTWRKNNPYRCLLHGARRTAKLRGHAPVIATAEQIRSFVERWDGKCHICQERIESRQDGSRRWVLDHDHKTGDMRGILCHRCNNRILPSVENEWDLVCRAVQYLREPPALIQPLLMQ